MTIDVSTTNPTSVLALTVAYDGAPFAGFARQPGQVTVQGKLEGALSTILRREVEVVCAGRTDAGVHALGQVVSLYAYGDEPRDEILLRSINALAEPGLAVREIRHACQGFSARFDAVGREYRYRVVSGPVPPTFLSPVAWWVKKPLDLDAMREGAAYLVGEHDFRSFCLTSSAHGKRTVRRVKAIELVEETVLGERCLTVHVVGNAFLHSMVRTIVGTLVEVGIGRHDPRWVQEALSACERSAAGATAPACGLTFWSVDYREGVWL
jgi:tRNA pseudouridine38-40 synthase